MLDNYFKSCSLIYPLFYEKWYVRILHCISFYNHDSRWKYLHMIFHLIQYYQKQDHLLLIRSNFPNNVTLNDSIHNFWYWFLLICCQLFLVMFTIYGNAFFIIIIASSLLKPHAQKMNFICLFSYKNNCKFIKIRSFCSKSW